MLSMSLPPLPPPLTSLLPFSPDHPHITQTARRQNQPKPSLHTSKHTLATLALEERTITQRKMAIKMYGYSWLKPAGCAKTMLGRREEELEREEMERQLREAEAEEANQVQREGEQQGETVEEGGEEQRDLDEEIPDADGDGEGEEIEEEDELEERDLDDEIPGADPGSPFHYDSRREPDSDIDGVEGETGITDDVEASHLHSSGRRQNQNRSPRSARGPLTTTGGSEWDEADEEALANAMLDEDELGEVGRDLDDEVPNGGERDLDDDVPDADDEGEWQHTDTELELEEGESAMDMDISGVQTRSQTRRRSGNAQVHFDVQTPDMGTGQSSGGGGRMNWLGSAGPRRNLFGRGPGGGGIFGARNITPPQQGQGQMVGGLQSQSVRRSGRRRRGTENEDDLRESLD